MLVCGVRVPEAGGMETCHQFTYRWLLAKGIIRGAQGKAGWTAQAMNTDKMTRLCFPHHGTSIRNGNTISVPSGSIVAFWDQVGGNLTHTMVADSTAYWAGTNNLTAFGLAGGRMMIGPMFDWVANGPNDIGWTDANNVWRRQGGNLMEVTYQTIIRKDISEL